MQCRANAKVAGRDKLLVRAQYSEAFEFFPTCGTIITLIETLALDKLDAVSAKTLTVIDFPCSFVENAYPLKPSEKQVDTGLSARFKSVPHRQQFMQILLEVINTNGLWIVATWKLNELALLRWIAPRSTGNKTTRSRFG